MDYATVQRRRANLGVGIIEINKQAGVLEQKYGIGIWCQNRPEWQLIGTQRPNPFQSNAEPFRSCLHVTIAVFGFPV